MTPIHYNGHDDSNGSHPASTRATGIAVSDRGYVHGVNPNLRNYSEARMSAVKNQSEVWLFNL